MQSTEEAWGSIQAALEKKLLRAGADHWAYFAESENGFPSPKA